MESQSQNTELRNNPEYIHPCSLSMRQVSKSHELAQQTVCVKHPTNS